jgi:hypothetical protein
MPDMRIGRRRLGSHNALLKTFPGADGLKTGFKRCPSPQLLDAHEIVDALTKRSMGLCKPRCLMIYAFRLPTINPLCPARAFTREIRC